MDTLSLFAINNSLIYLRVPTTFEKLEAIRVAIDSQVMSNNLLKIQGDYSLSMFLNSVLQKSKIEWTVIKNKHPEVLKYCTFNDRDLGCISYFGMFYVAVITGFDPLAIPEPPQKLESPQGLEPPQGLELPKKRYRCKTQAEIYVLRDLGHKALKVGFSMNTTGRIKEHLTSHPFLHLVAVFPAISIKTEYALHSKLTPYRINIGSQREWYKDIEKTRNTINLFMIRQGLIQEPNVDLLLDPPPLVISW